MGMQDLLRMAIGASGSAAVNYVAPIGRSVDTVAFYSGKRIPVVVAKEQADAIRDSQKLEWKPVTSEVFVTDGFKYHSSGLSIQNPDNPENFMMADVVDPIFSEDANPYTLAAQRRGTIKALARRGYKNGQLAKVQIIEFEGSLND